MTPFAADAGLDREAVLAAVGQRLRRFYGKRGDDVIAANLEMVDRGVRRAHRVTASLGLPGPERSLVVAADQARDLTMVAP